MATDVKVPSLGESITEVEIGDWLKAEGDAVKKDEEIVALESEKATVQLPAPAGGTLGKILKRKGDKASIGEVIALIESVQKPAEQAEPASKSSDKTEFTKKQQASAEPAKPAPVAAATAEPAKPAPVAAATAEQAEPAQKSSDRTEFRKKQQTSAETAKPAPVALAPKPRSAPTAALAAVEPPATRPPEERRSEELVPAPAVPPPVASPNGPAVQTSRPAPVIAPAPSRPQGERQEEAVPMTPLRRTVAQRLVEAQKTMAMLTTFNEIDMSAVMALRKDHQDAFTQKHGIKLGFMSFFVKSAIEALKAIPQLNASIRANDIIYHNYFDIGIAIGSGKGLVVPVLRNAERLSFSEIEKAIANFGARAKENKLTPDELQSGTFTITNGGVYGSLLSTPIVNPPQSGILGMHAIQQRPIAVDGNVVVRPMMYVALSYDHRLVDGREAVTFLVRIKELVENPARILLEV